jgi:hypothetical protein
MGEIEAQCDMLLRVHASLQDLFDTFKGSVQFFRHKDQKEIFVIQIRRGHLVDVGRFLMGLSFYIKERYHVFQGVGMREQLKIPQGGYGKGKDYEYAFKHVFLRFQLHPKLQELLFTSGCLKKDEVYQDMARMPYVVKDVLRRAAPASNPKVVQSFVRRQMKALSDKEAYEKAQLKPSATG